jgi:hypothetical protein
LIAAGLRHASDSLSHDVPPDLAAGGVVSCDPAT